MIGKLGVVDIKIPKLIHANVIAINVLHLDDRCGDLIVAVYSKEIHPAWSCFSVRVSVSVDQNY